MMVDEVDNSSARSVGAAREHWREGVDSLDVVAGDVAGVKDVGDTVRNMNVPDKDHEAEEVVASCDHTDTLDCNRPELGTLLHGRQ